MLNFFLAVVLFFCPAIMAQAQEMNPPVVPEMPSLADEPGGDVLPVSAVSSVVSSMESGGEGAVDDRSADAPSGSVRAGPSTVIRVGSPSEEEDVLDVLDLKNMDILDVLKLISQKSGLNIVAGQNVKGRITVFLKNIEVQDALRIIVEAYGWAYTQDGGILKIITEQEYEARYGHKFGQEIRTRLRQLLFAKAPDVAVILNEVKGKTGKVIADAKSGTLILIDEPARLEAMEEIIRQVDVPVETEVFSLGYATAEAISAKVAEVLTPAVGTMRFDERSNKVMVSDTAQVLQKVRRIIEAFDEKDKEVLIEAKIIQIALNDEHKMGVDWEAIVSDYHNLDLVSDFDVLGATDKKGKLSIGTVSANDYTAIMEALDTVGATNILSAPRITAVNNKEAKILVGSTEPYVTTTTTTPSSGPTTTAESVNFIEVGVKLFVTPTIHNDGFISMKIKPEVSSVTSNVTTSNNNTIPVVETSEAETTVIVKDGVSVVIGGLIKEETIKSTKKVPLLGDIPIVGFAFRSESDSVSKTEIVIFLTPQIMTGDVSEASALTAGYAGRQGIPPFPSLK